jgi:ATP-binding cassette subfamily B protein
MELSVVPLSKRRMLLKTDELTFADNLWSMLWHYLRAQLYPTIGLFVLMLVEIGLSLTIPQVIRSYIDKLQERALSADLVRAALLYLAFVLLRIAIRVIRIGLNNHLSWKATNAVRHDLTKHILALDQRFHHTHPPGELLERIDGDVSRLNSFFAELLPDLSGAVILALGTLVVLAFDDWHLSLILFVFMLGFILIHRWDQQWSGSYWEKERQYATQLSSFVEERVSGAKDIHTSGAVPHTMEQFHQKITRHALQSVKGEVVTDAGWGVSGAFYALGFAAAMGAGAYLFYQGSISLGVVYLIVQYVQLLGRPLTRIGGQLENLVKAQVSLKRISALFSTRPSLHDDKGAAFPPGVPISIDIEGVEFGYDAHNAVLHNISFSLSPGETLGLLGRTGSGKSTLARLLFRFYDVTQGVIRLNGENMDAYELFSMRRSISMVTQDVQLLHASVRDNITLFQESISENAILEALQHLGLGEWLNRLPEGLDTQLRPEGSTLSAGQAQLLAVTRAFLKNPGLVILDEASSRVDPVTANLLEGAITRLLENRTAVIIAHRLETVRRVDKIMILEQGRVREYGTYAALSADLDSTLSALLRTGATEVFA